MSHRHAVVSVSLCDVYESARKGRAKSGRKLRVSSVNAKALPYARTETVKEAYSRTVDEVKVADKDALLYCNSLRIALRKARFADKSAEKRQKMIRAIGLPAYEKQVKQALTAYASALKTYGFTDATARAYGRGTGNFTPSNEQ